MRTTWWLSLAACLLPAAAGPARADEQAELKALIDKAVQAMGGEAKVAKFKTITSKGKGAIESVGYADESYWQFPDQYRFDMELDINGNKVKQVVVINGDKGWIKLGDSTQEMTKEVLAAFKDYLYAMHLVNDPLELKDKASKLSPLGEVKVEGRPAVGVQVSRKGRRDVNVYFDKETGLPVKSETSAPNLEGGQEVTQEFFFGEYKEFDGAKVATKMLWKRDGKKYAERELGEVKPEAKLDDGVFAKP